MDRTTRGRCGALALAALLSVGCGFDGQSTTSQARKDAAPAHGQATQSAPSAASTSSEPKHAAAEIVEVVSTPPYDALAPLDAPWDDPPAGSVGQDVAMASDPANLLTTAPPTDSDPSSAVALDEEPDNAADDAGGSEIRFASPHSANGMTTQAHPRAASRPVRPRHSIVELAVRPQDRAADEAAAAETKAAPPVAATGSAVPEERQNVAPAPQARERTEIVSVPLVDMPARRAVSALEGPQGEQVRIAIAPPPVVEAPATERAEIAQAPAETSQQEPNEPEAETAAPAKTDLVPLVVTPRAAPPDLAPQVSPAAPAPQNPLPPVMPVYRSPATIATLSRADERVRHAIQLAEKGALYAARKEFTSAIKLIAQAHDVEQGTRQHTQAAIAGFQALKEANDFAASGSATGDVDVARVVAGHRTPVLKDADAVDMPSSIAVQYYYGYAKEQLALAAARETVASIALYGLGKIIIAGAGASAQQLEYTGPAMALYQAALIAEPQNYRAAHELGVLLAGSGQLELARQMLMTSASASAQPTAWQNLAALHARMGEEQLAQQAQQQAATLQTANPEPKGPPVQWVDPATFSRTVPATDSLMPPAAVQAPAATTATPSRVAAEPNPPPSKAARTGSKSWNPLNLRR